MPSAKAALVSVPLKSKWRWHDALQTLWQTDEASDGIRAGTGNESSEGDTVSHYYHPDTIEALSKIAQCGDTTKADLAKLLGVSPEVAQGRINNLNTKGLIDSHRKASGCKPGYFITPFGKTLLQRMTKSAAVPMGEIAGPRTHNTMSGDTYRGDQSIPVRAGSMDAFGAPSLFNGERIERKRPTIMGVRPV